MYLGTEKGVWLNIATWVTHVQVFKARTRWHRHAFGHEMLSRLSRDYFHVTNLSKLLAEVWNFNGSYTPCTI